MRFSHEEFDVETLRTLKFALETARVRLNVLRSAEEELQSLADIIAAQAKLGFVDAEGLARRAMRGFRERRDKSPATLTGRKP
jgi:hypothetical protein